MLPVSWGGSYELSDTRLVRDFHDGMEDVLLSFLEGRRLTHESRNYSSDRNEQLKDNIPEFGVGDTVRVYARIKEG